MTRLISGWIADIEDELRAQDKGLRDRTGLTMLELSARAAGVGAAELSDRLAACRAAAVPVTSGLGTIGSFSGSVAAIARYLGADSFVTGATDVDGFYEAARRGAQVLLMADDERYLAINRLTGAVAENDECTALGYSLALDAMSDGLSGREVLLMGCGRMGTLAARALTALGARVSVYDKRDEVFYEGFPYARIAGRAALADFSLVFDATSEGGWLRAGDLAPSVRMVAPGVPFSLDAEAAALYGGGVYHDVLQLGTAVMLARAVCG